MHYVQLNQGNKIPQLGLGVYQTADGQQTMDAVCWALEAGYRHIDTAKIYGNEKSVGDAIRESKIPRQQIFLTTKLWNDDIRAGRTEEAFNESLAALQTDYIDLYLIHWPAEGFTEAWTAMEKLYKQGRIRAIGVSNFHKCHLDELEKRADVMPAVNQVESHPYFNNNELIKIGVLKNCFDDPRAIAEMVAERTHSQVVQVIGKKIVLYKPDKDKPKIELPR